MHLSKKQKWLRTIAWLRREFPTRYSARVRSVSLKDGHHGDACLYGTWFRIRINKRKPFDTRVDTLMHEWAHALTWFGSDRDNDHGPEWGVAYASVYNTWGKWNYGEGIDPQS